MQYVWNATFIDELVPKAAALRRCQSEPSVGPSSGVSSYYFAHERAYVAMLETEARLLESPESPRKLSHGRTASAEWSAASVSSTQCPHTPRSQLSNDTCSDFAQCMQVSNEATTPGAFTSLSSPMMLGTSARSLHRRAHHAAHASLSSNVSFGEESPAAPVAPAPSTPACGCNPGSVGHPGLCKRPCIQFARGDCAAGAECQFCHLAHSGRSPHLDKRHRELLRSLPFGKRVAVALPIIRLQVARLGIPAEAQELLAGLESAACPEDSDEPSATTTLSRTLGALSLRSLLTAVCKAADTPEDELERIRRAEQAQIRR